MEFRRFLINKLILFFMLSTLITVVVSLTGSVFDPGASFGYDALLAPMKYAAYCMLPTLITYSRHELSTKEMLGRKALMLLLLEAVILFIAFRSPAIDTGSIKVVLTLAGSVLVIFLLTDLFMWLKDSAEAKKMNSDLAEFQKLHGRTE